MGKKQKNILIIGLIILGILALYLILRSSGTGDFNSQVNERQKAIETDIFEKLPTE